MEAAVKTFCNSLRAKHAANAASGEDITKRSIPADYRGSEGFVFACMENLSKTHKKVYYDPADNVFILECV